MFCNPPASLDVLSAFLCAPNLSLHETLRICHPLLGQRPSRQRPVLVPLPFFVFDAYDAMSKFLKALLLSAVATGVAAILLQQLDLESAAAMNDDDGLPGMNPDDMAEEDVEMLLKELASQLT